MKRLLPFNVMIIFFIKIANMHDLQEIREYIQNNMVRIESYIYSPELVREHFAVKDFFETIKGIARRIES